jgi:acyl-CoA synthetase (NDP forming)
MFSQSGNVGVQMLDYGRMEGIGFQKFVSSGNEADLNASDYINYFGRDEATRVILGYIEGVKADSDFFSVAKEVSRKKPIVVIKGGRTDIGGKAATSHSASMAGSYRVNSSAFHQAGIIQTLTSLELIDCAKAFSQYPLPESNRVGIITRGGGWGVLAADACEEAGLIVPPLPDDLINEMDKVLPGYWNRGNPIDLVAVIDNDPFPACLKMLAEWDGVDAVIALGAGLRSFSFQYSEELKGPKELMDALGSMEAFLKGNPDEDDPVMLRIRELIEQTGKPIISVSVGSEYSHKEYMEKYKIVSFPTPERAVRVLKQMYRYRRFLNSPE